MNKVKVGVIGCGHISSAYLRNCTQKYPILDVVACADLFPEAAQKKAEEFGIPRVCTPEELLADPEIDIVINLTVPKAHADISLRALEAGKHVYSEKPFGINREEARRVMEKAKEKGLIAGCAPDTFLGAGLQTCRKLLDEGWIGTPYAAHASIMMGNHAEQLMKAPSFFFQEGGGPLFDMGPYYVTALVFLLGPVSRVAGMAKQLHTERQVVNPNSPQFGERYPIETTMNDAALLDFASGPSATLRTAKESFGYDPVLIIYGTEGNLYCNDPNMFGGSVYVQRKNGEKKEVPLAFPFAEEGRGLGAADMAHALQTGRRHRANEELAFHVVDVMTSIHESARQGKVLAIESKCERPAPFPMGLVNGLLD